MKTLPLGIWLVLILMVVACGGVAPPTPTRVLPTEPLPTTTPGVPGVAFQRVPFLSSGTWQPDVTYCWAGDQALSMDVYYPDPFKDDPAPAAVYLHMGGGDKDSVDIDLLGQLLKRGYYVIAPNWREASVVHPTQDLADLECSVRYLRAKASAYHIDPKRIGAWGCSDGGYLASMLALTDTSGAVEGGGGLEDQSSRVDAAAPRDGWAFFAYDDPNYASISPLSYVSKIAPPFLIFTSDDDPLGVPAMKVLYDRLTAAGASATRVVVEGSNHCEPYGKPDRAQRATMIADFFDRSFR